MLAPRRSPDNPREEAEKPFWISFADMMTALMVLFLIITVITLVAVSTREDALEQQAEKLQQQRTELSALAEELEYLKVRDRENSAQQERQSTFRSTLEDALPEGVELREDDVLDWGSRMEFEKGESSLTPEQEDILRKDIRTLLKVATGKTGDGTLRRFVLEGFASPEGSYLYNLNLSLDRSQRVVCALLDPSPRVGSPLSARERKQVVDLFLISGYSSNAAIRNDDEASRRVELRLEWDSGQSDDDQHPETLNDIGDCALGS